MRIVSGTTDQYLYFVAVDGTDFTTRETGLATFTVYRSRNGAAPVLMTPVVAELSAANMPGVYSLLLDEDMTLTDGNDSEEMVFHISHAGMADVTRAIELYRAKITAGNTLGVAADGDVSGNVDGNVASVTGAVGSVTGSVGSVTGAVGSVTGAVGSVTAGVTVTTNNDKTGYALSAAGVDAIWDEVITGHVTADTFGLLFDQQIKTNVPLILADTAELQTDWVNGGRLDNLLDGAASAGDPWTTAIPGAYGAGTAGNIVGNNLNAAVSTLATSAALATAQTDLNTITGADGVTLATAQALYAPAKAGAQMDLVNAPNATAVAAIQAGLATSTALATVDGIVDDILVDTGTTIPGTLATLATTTALNTVDANVDAILLDTAALGAAHAEPTGVPAANESPLDKIGYIYAALRNKTTVTSAALTYYDDAGTAMWSKALSDDATTYTEAEGA